MLPFDFGLLLFLLPAFALAVLAQFMVRSAYAGASRIPARLSGFAAARKVLDAAGLFDVAIEQVPGSLSDHYDPRHKVLRLSQGVYHGNSAAAIGIAAHEAGHAIQDARHYAPLMVRNAAVPVASFGSNFGMTMAFFGLALGLNALLVAGIVVFSGVVFFQLVNLPVEFDASARAKRQLMDLGLASDEQMVWVRKVLNAAALTYVAATLQSVLTLLYYILRYTNQRD
jgi:Zn-dependent membrane protease YugP